MTLKDDLITFQNGWLAVADYEREELRLTSIEMKWKQLNSIIRLAIGLGIFTGDENEELVYQRWAKLKAIAESQKQ